jgi:hypothetical protein
MSFFTGLNAAEPSTSILVSLKLPNNLNPRTEKRAQAFCSLQELRRRDSIVLGLINRHVNEALLDRIEESAAGRVCCCHFDILCIGLSEVCECLAAERQASGTGGVV